MKVILSRKGMDSRAGGIPSPILPDGTLLSLPIPEHSGGVSYGNLRFRGQTYQEIIRQLQPNFDFDKSPFCHLDPDIYSEIEGRPAEWNPAFGQCDASARHLDSKGVGIGDVFLFYGMFKQTKYKPDGTLSFVRGAPIRHIVYGYMKVGDILRNEQKISQRYPWHPHGANPNRPYNRLYIPATYGTFQYREDLMLSKEGQNSRRLWALPAFFADNGISISWQGDNKPVLADGCAELNSACRGQEFVIIPTTPEQEHNLADWADSLISKGAMG